MPKDPNQYFNTMLTPPEEKGFGDWVKKNKIPFKDEPKSDYDMRGYYKDNVIGPMGGKQASNKHFPDTYKTPFHKTFSNESKYATPDAPRWIGDKLVARDGSVVADETPKPKRR